MMACRFLLYISGKSLLRLFLFCLGLFLHSNQSLLIAQRHPCLYARPEDRKVIINKISNVGWASSTYDDILKQIDKYVDQHQKNPEWILSRMAMYWKDGEHFTQCYLKNQNWDYGEGNAPVPTVRMPGMRVWNKYQNVPLEDRIPYNETGDMWGVDRQNPNSEPVLVPYKESGHMVRNNNVEILKLAEKSAFVYWLTQDEKYALFATDIFNAWLVGTYYMNPIIDKNKSTGGFGGWEPGGICGYYDYEQIHDDLAYYAAGIYDFVYDYANSHPHSHLKELKKGTKEIAEEVFKRFINIGMVRGGRTGNWNVNGWNMMLRPILMLSSNNGYQDGKGKEYYLHYLLNESTGYHESIPDILKNYDVVTGLWPESPGYAFGIVQMLLEWSHMLLNSDIDIIADYPILQKAANAIFPWMDSRQNMIVFGDTRGGNANFRTFECLLAYYTAIGDKEGIKRNSYPLYDAIRQNRYTRNNSDWMGLCLFVDSLSDDGYGSAERASYSRFHRMLTMKNKNFDVDMMVLLYGGRDGSHLSPNGLAIQLYGYGYPLVPDAAAYESYWSNDYSYHQSATGSNTILPGYTEGDIAINAMEPEVGDASLTSGHALTPYFDFADVSAGEKRRVVAMAHNNKGYGYYVDIFRSDLADNDYLFHNVGKSCTVSDINDRALKLDSLNRWDYIYNDGYKWFSNLRRISYDKTFKVRWTITDSLSSDLWMIGEKGRTLYLADAPSTTLYPSLMPDGVSAVPMPTPTLVVRQQNNNALTAPFMGVYECFRNNESFISAVEKKPCEADNAIVKITSGNTVDYIFSSSLTGDDKLVADKISVCGLMGFVRYENEKITCMYLSNGTSIEAPGWTIKTEKKTKMAVYELDGKWYCSSLEPIVMLINGESITMPAGYDQPIVFY